MSWEKEGPRNRWEGNEEEKGGNRAISFRANQCPKEVERGDGEGEEEKREGGREERRERLERKGERIRRPRERMGWEERRSEEGMELWDPRAVQTSFDIALADAGGRRTRRRR